MKKRIVSLLLASALLATSINFEALAAGKTESSDGYKLVWSDEFDGDTLNRDNWNVELHDPGWVNSEKQAYVDSTDNIYVSDGCLHLQAKEESSSGTGCTAIEGNILSNSIFSEGKDGWTETIADWDAAAASSSVDSSDGSITYDISNAGTADWEVQLKQTGITLEAGKTYMASFYITSDVSRSFKYGAMNNTNYTWYGGGEKSLEAGVETAVTYSFTMPAADSDVSYYISLGKYDSGDTPAGKIKISDLYLAEIGTSSTETESEQASQESNEEGSETTTQTIASNMIANADFSSSMDSWTETIANWEGATAVASSSISDGAITYNVENVGDADWHVQLKQSGLSLKNGKTYHCSYNINSTTSRQIKSGVQSPTYEWFGGSDANITAGDNTVSFDFNMSSDSEGAFYISLGNCGGENEAGTFTISNISLTEVTASSEENVKEENQQEPVENTEAAQATVELTAPRATRTEGSATVKSYTSGRISTQNLQTFTYGRFEVRAKVPAGAGYLPAFWLMANDENIYGQWPRCGEIDCMEVMGQETSTTYGTIHYGNPHAQNQGTYTLSDGSFSDDFHTFTCDWEPGKITWYVDGEEYYSTDDWYSTTEGQGTLTYPAPFDQPFYIILNLAVGGSWVGDIDENTSFDNNPYVIDYVRVYQKDSYDEDVTAPVKELNLKEAVDGNYITNGQFTEDESLTDDESWKFLTANGGEGTATIKNNQININTEDDGTVDYSIQLVQAGLPFEKGATYQVQFDAYADEDREMGVDIKAPDKGYITYMDHQTAKLTTEPQTYTYTFKMTSTTDANGRLEYNMGATGSLAAIHIGNVSVSKIAEADPDEVEAKTVLANGNYVYNGNFQEGTKHLGDWTINADSDMNYGVTSFADGRRFKAEIPSAQTLTLSQTDLAFAAGQSFSVSMDIEAENDGKAEVTVGGLKKTIDVKAGKNTYSYKINEASFTDKNVSIKLYGENTYYLDNVSITESALLKNGSFNDGLTGFTVYIDGSANASKVVDSLSEDNALDITINDTGDQDWKVQVKQENISLEKGKTYKLTLQAKSSLPRKMRVIMQGQEARGWSVYSNDNIVDLTDEFQTITDTFTMNEDTDSAAFFSICLGKIDEQITTQHRVVIDNITLVEVDTEKSALDDNTPKENPVVNPGNNDNSSQSAGNTTSGSTATASSDSAVTTTASASDSVSVSDSGSAATGAVSVTPVIQPLPATKLPAADTKVAKTESTTPAKQPVSLPETTLDPAVVEDPETPLATEEETQDIPDEEVPAASEEEPIVAVQTPEKTGFFASILEAIKNFFLAIINFFR